MKSEKSNKRIYLTSPHMSGEEMKNIEEAIKDRIKKGKRVKAILPVHLYGMSANMDEILSIA